MRKQYRVRSKNVFLLGTLVGDTNSMLDARCKELGIRGYSKMKRDRKQHAILGRTVEDPTHGDFEPKLEEAE